MSVFKAIRQLLQFFSVDGYNSGNEVFDASTSTTILYHKSSTMAAIIKRGQTDRQTKAEK